MGLAGHKRITVDVRDAMYAHVQRALEHHETTISAFVRRALRETLERDGFIQPRPAPKAVEREQRPSAA